MAGPTKVRDWAHALAILSTFPAYLTTETEHALRDFMVASPPDEDTLAKIATLFVELWQRRPLDRYWYGDLRQQFVTHAVLPRLAAQPRVQQQLLDDFRVLAPRQRKQPTELGCRRLARAAELLLQAPTPACRDVLVPIIELDRIDRQRTRPMRAIYEDVYWGMMRVARALGADL